MYKLFKKRDTPVSQNAMTGKSKIRTPLTMTGAAIFIGAMLFYTYDDNSKALDSLENVQSSATSLPTMPKPQTEKATNDENPEIKQDKLVADFLIQSQKSIFSPYFKGLVGDPIIRDTVTYENVNFSEAITLSPLEIPFPTESSLLEGFPFTTFGDASLVIENPLNTSIFAKVIYHDESDATNYAVRHVYLSSNSSLTVTGLVDGIYQLAALSPDNPKLSFVTHQFNIYEKTEDGNKILLLGKLNQPSSIF